MVSCMMDAFSHLHKPILNPNNCGNGTLHSLVSVTYLMLVNRVYTSMGKLSMQFEYARKVLVVK